MKFRIIAPPDLKEKPKKVIPLGLRKGNLPFRVIRVADDGAVTADLAFVSIEPGFTLGVDLPMVYKLGIALRTEVEMGKIWHKRRLTRVYSQKTKIKPNEFKKIVSPRIFVIGRGCAKTTV